jgi:hypothetical protein
MAIIINLLNDSLQNDLVCDIQHNDKVHDTQHNDNDTADCCNAEWCIFYCYAECHNGQCFMADCDSAIKVALIFNYK